MSASSQMTYNLLGEHGANDAVNILSSNVISCLLITLNLKPIITTYREWK